MTYESGIARAALLCLLATVVVAGGCGRRTAPMPVEGTLPVPAGVMAWQREARLLVAWRLPADAVALRHGGLEGFELVVERLPLGCLSCAPEETSREQLATNASGMRIERDWARYGMSLPHRPATWRIRVAGWYGAGRSAFSPVALFEGPADVPAQQLLWEPVVRRIGKAGEKRSLSARLYWQPRRERIVQILTKQGVMVKQDRNYRGNLYSRRAGGNWTLRPVNIVPLETGQLIVPARRDGPRQFSLRLVDQFGNEGPASAPVSISAGGGRP